MTKNSPVVRFAPSPTGFLHIGGLRTALYNYLFARNLGGKIIAVENLIENFTWTGLNFDEGPGIGGNNGPYFQSERLEIYKKYADELINKGKAYYCFCTQERLDALRAEQQKLKLSQAKYDKHCLHLSKKEVEEKINSGLSKLIRLNIEPNKNIFVDDLVRGRVEFESNNVDDQVLIKSDGFPTYHLANVVDDYLMGVTHVIRGEEWLSSMPKHVLLYESLDWEKPLFAHLPLLLNPDKSKLSKRQGDVAVEDYRAKGYLKEALLNFVALLGWNPGDEQEFFTIDELINKFTIDRVHKSGAVFNIEKMDWLNAEHLRSKPNEEILEMLKDELSKSHYKDLKVDYNYLLLIIEAMKPRVTFVKEFITKCPYFYEAPEKYDESVIKKRWKDHTPEQITMLRDNIEKIDGSSPEKFEEAFTLAAEELGIGKGKLIHPVRLAVSGIGTGPGVYDLLFILGKEEVIKRINHALETISVPDKNPGEN
jgi:glutamyl-tRNA synthetase